MANEQVSQEQYDAWVADIRSGKVVRHKGRLAKNIDELHFLIDSVDVGPVALPPPGAPHILGITGFGAVEALQQENAELRRQLMEMDAERRTSSQLQQGSKIDLDKPVDESDTTAGQAIEAVKAKDAKAAKDAGVPAGQKQAVAAQAKATDAANAVAPDTSNAAPPENVSATPPAAESTDEAVAGVTQAETEASALAQNTK